jgi:hypothetical protein
MEMKGVSSNYENFLSLQAEGAWEENTERSNNSGSHVGDNEDECLWTVTPCGLLDRADISGGSLRFHGEKKQVICPRKERQELKLTASQWLPTCCLVICRMQLTFMVKLCSGDKFLVDFGKCERRSKVLDQIRCIVGRNFFFYRGWLDGPVWGLTRLTGGARRRSST